jgi:hypothetical protein
MCGPFGWSLTVRVFFLKNPPRSLCCHDWVQLIRKYAAPAENQAVLVKLDYPLFCLISDPKHLRQCTPLSERRHPERGNQVARLRLRSLLESLRYKWTSHLSPEPRLVRVCTQTVPVVTNVKRVVNLFEDTGSVRELNYLATIPDRVLVLYGRIKASNIINYIQMLSLTL